LDWSQPAVVLDRQVRALSPWPGCFTDILRSPTEHERLILKSVRPVEGGSGKPGSVLQADKHGLKVATGSGVLELLEVQRRGGKPMSAKTFLLGADLQVGMVLGTA